MRGKGALFLVLGLLAFSVASATHNHALGSAPPGFSIRAQHESTSSASDCLACRLSHERVALAIPGHAVHGIDCVEELQLPSLASPHARLEIAPRASRAPPTLLTA